MTNSRCIGETACSLNAALHHDETTAPRKTRARSYVTILLSISALVLLALPCAEGSQHLAAEIENINYYHDNFQDSGSGRNGDARHGGSEIIVSGAAMSAASAGRHLAGSRVGGGRPGEGDWWWVSEHWGSKYEHMFAAGYTKNDLKGLLFLDDNDDEAEAADCLEPINSAQWSDNYQMHYVHFERNLLNKDNKDVFLENLYAYIETNDVHTVVFDWDKTVTAVEDWIMEVSEPEPQKLNPIIIEFMRDNRTSNFNFGIATYNRYKEAGLGEDMVDFHIAHASLKAALGLKRLTDRIQTWTCWGRNDPIIVVDLKKFESASSFIQLLLERLPLRPGFDLWWDLTDRTGNKRQHIMASGFSRRQMERVLYIDSSYKEAVAAGRSWPTNRAGWSEQYQVHYLYYKAKRFLKGADDESSFTLQLLQYVQDNGIRHIIFEFIGTLVPKNWAIRGADKFDVESVDRTLINIIRNKDARRIHFGIATYSRLNNDNGYAMGSFPDAYQILRRALKVKELTRYFTTWTCWGDENPIIAVEMSAYEAQMMGDEKEDGKRDMTAMVGSAQKE